MARVEDFGSPREPDICPETSDGWHTLQYQDGTGPCKACGQEPGPDAEAVRQCNACPAPASCSEFGRCTLEAGG